MHYPIPAAYGEMDSIPLDVVGSFSPSPVVIAAVGMQDEVIDGRWPFKDWGRRIADIGADHHLIRVEIVPDHEQE